MSHMPITYLAAYMQHVCVLGRRAFCFLLLAHLFICVRVSCITPPHTHVLAGNRRGDTPLHAAASSADWAILRLILDKQGDPKKLNVAGEAATHVACRAGDVNLTKALVKAGARVKASANDGTTPLHEACAHG